MPGAHQSRLETLFLLISRRPMEVNYNSILRFFDNYSCAVVVAQARSPSK
jgi:hypothetical protein